MTSPNYIVNGDMETTSGSGTYYQDPFNNLSGWASTLSASVAGNVLTLGASAGVPKFVRATNAQFYTNCTALMRFKMATVANMDLTVGLNIGGADAGYFADFVGGFIKVERDVRGAGIASQGVAGSVSAGNWYWMKFTASLSGSTWTLTATIYADSAGVIGAQIGTCTTTDTTYSGAGYISINNANNSQSNDIGGLSDGSGFVVTGPVPTGMSASCAGWTGTGSIPGWAAYYTDSSRPVGSQKVLRTRSTNVAGTHDVAWTRTDNAAPSSASLVASYVAKAGTAGAAGQVTVTGKDATGGGGSTTGTITHNPTLTTSFASYSATASGFTSTASLITKLGVNGQNQDLEWDAVQVETGTVATAYRDSSVRILSGDTVTPTDTMARVSASKRPLAQAAAIADAMARRFAAIRPLTAAVAASDAASRVMAYIRPRTVAQSMVDAVAPSFAVFRKITDRVTAATNMQRAATFTRPFAQALGVAEITSRITAIVRPVLNSLGVTDAARSSFGVMRRIADQVGATGVFSRVVRYAKLPTFIIKDRSSN